MQTKPNTLFCYLSAGLLLMNSCVNSIKEENGKTPITISPRVEGSITRVTNTSFEDKDAVGLYVVARPGGLDEERCVDNLQFVYSESKGLVPQKTAYFPEGDDIYDFISYHPYKAKAVGEGKTTIGVTTLKDQRTWESLSQSDFLVAKKEKVGPTKEKIQLSYRHKFYLINIKIKPNDEYTTVQQLLDADPDVTIANVYTKAVYDFETDTFSEHSEPVSIRSNGSWKPEGGMIAGKCAIVIPQKFAGNQPFITVVMDGRTYQCALPGDYTGNSGDAEDYTLTLRESIGVEISSGVENWNNIAGREVDAKEVIPPSYISVDGLNFNASNVFHVRKSDNSVVGEICREYLLSGSMAASAIVYYPVRGGKTDPTKGTVLRLIGETAGKHGGSLSWNTTTTFSYTEGNRTPIDYIYITPEGELSTDEDGPRISVKAEEYVLEDVRDGEVLTYPVVKIATRYWLGVNLQCTRYTTGASIPVGENFSEASAKYCTPDNENMFYNAAAATNPLFVPEGWRISNVADWDMLKTYTGNDASLLKKGAEWAASSSHKAYNHTGFGGLAAGLYNDTYQEKAGVYASATYWCMEDANPKAIAKSITLTGQYNEIRDSGVKAALGLTVRLVRK